MIFLMIRTLLLLLPVSFMRVAYTQPANKV